MTGIKHVGVDMTNYEMNKFLEYIAPEDEAQLRSMRKYAKDNHVPIIRREMQHFMEVVLLLHKPVRILEIGTAIGFSAILMARIMETYEERSRIEIISIERNDKRFSLARENIKMAGKEDLISVVKGDAEEVLKDLSKKKERFDMIFMDAAKGQYMVFLPYCMEVLNVDGVLISDNVLQDGHVAKSRYSIVRRQRTIHKRMREYLYELNHREDLKTSVLTLADGVTVSVKIK